MNEKPDDKTPAPPAETDAPAAAGAGEDAVFPRETSPTLKPGLVSSAAEAPSRNVEQLMRIPVSLSVVIAKKQMLLEDILHLATGSVIEFDKSHKDLIDLAVGGKTIASGEAVTIRDKFGIMISRIGSVQETLNRIRSGAEGA